jgi:excisionase family DNA binding protein
MNKEQASKFLNISVRTLQRYMSNHKIEFKMRRTKTGEEAIFDKEELRRFKREMKEVTITTKGAISPLPQPITHLNENEEPNTQLAIASSTLLQRFMTMLRDTQYATATKIQPTVAIESKPLLTLIEANKLTGLSQLHLREAIHSKLLKARIIGRGYRIKRADLDDYITNL